MAKVQKASTETKVTNETKVKVTVNDVKPQILFAKRKLHKLLVGQKIADEKSTVSRPILKGGLEPEKVTEIRKAFNAIGKEMINTYPHTTMEQAEYIKAHFNVHKEKYIK